MGVDECHQGISASHAGGGCGCAWVESVDAALRGDVGVDQGDEGGGVGAGQAAFEEHRSVVVGGEGQVPGALGVPVVAFEPVGFFLVGDFGGEAFE